MSDLKLFLLVLSLAVVSFGGGNTLMGGLERELVQAGHITPERFAVAVALGQSTPGPLAAFTTAVGMAVTGVTGAIAATMALIVVSLGTVLIISQLPAAWFQLPRVRAGLTAVGPIVAAIAFYLGARIWLTGSPTALGTAIALAVAAARLAKWPTAPVMLGAVLFGMLAL